MGFVVFLDVDGVLNTRRTCQKSLDGYTGIDDERVKILSNSIKEMRGDGVVLTTTWKNLKPEDEDYVYFVGKLEQFGIKIIGKTEDNEVNKRGEGIQKYLDAHPEIDEFVVLDDNEYEFSNTSRLWESFITTDGKGIEHSAAASKTPSIPAMLFLDAVKKYS